VGGRDAWEGRVLKKMKSLEKIKSWKKMNFEKKNDFFCLKIWKKI
jgi:hypothetical protein